MAAGGSSPELFTSAMGTFMRSNVGFGAIVGSAVFNFLFVVGVCAMSTQQPMKLSWYPLIRDSLFYCVVMLALAIFFGIVTPMVIEWWEALILHLLYWVYVTMMMYNHVIVGWLFSPKQPNDEESIELIAASASPRPHVSFNATNTFRSGILHLLISNKPIFDTAGTVMVSKITGTVETAFAQFDKDGSGEIDSQELAAVMDELGCPLNQSEIDHLLSVLVGTISF